MSVRLTPWTNPYQSGIGTEITDEKEINVVLRDTNNLIQLTQNNELYTDLQLANWLKPTDTIPVWVTTGRVLSWDGRPVTWTLVCSKTTSWDITMYLYWDNWTIYVNNWGNTWKILQQQLTAWNWISIVNNTVTNTGVTSVNGQIWDVNTNPICIIQVSSDWYTTTWTITQGEYVDGAIVILTGSGRVTQTWLEITIDGETHNLGILPREWQNWESFSINWMVTWMLKTLVIGWVSSEMFFHWRGWEFNTPA